MLTGKETRSLLLAMQTQIPEEICRVMFSTPILRSVVKHTMMREIDEQCSNLCVRKISKSGKQPSVLHVTRKGTKKKLEEFTWTKVLEEMKERAPDVLDFLCAIGVPKLKDGDKQIPPLCTAYGILLNNRWKELSLIQKVITTLFGVGHCTAKVCIYTVFV